MKHRAFEASKLFLMAFLLLASTWAARDAAGQGAPGADAAPEADGGIDALPPAGTGETALEEAVALPAGTVVPIVLADYLNTRSSQVGDVFYADTTYPVWLNQKLVIPKGSSVRGTVTAVTRPGRIKGKGRLTVRFDDILLPNGVRRTFAATFRGIHSAGEEKLDRKAESVEGGGSAGDDVGTVVGTTTGGTLLGAVVGSAAGNVGRGAAVGAGAGAAAGVAQVLFSRGRDLVIEPGTRFDLELRQPMRFAWNELEFSGDQIEDAGRNLRPAPSAAPRASPSSGGRGRLGRGGGVGIGLPGGLPGARF